MFSLLGERSFPGFMRTRTEANRRTNIAEDVTLHNYEHRAVLKGEGYFCD